MRKSIVIFYLFSTILSVAQDVSLCWGDQGNGMYANPILNADYSDPDVIRVGTKYYMVASDFHFMGMQVLESEDMVNWRIITQIYKCLDFKGWNENERYAGGSWAPAIRFHDGKFWVFFCTPDEGLFMTNAESPAGPWTPLHLVKAVPKWEDPCPFWDEDGKAYLGRSIYGAGPIIIHQMSYDGKQLLDSGITVYKGPVAEGTKILKKDGYYYLSIPEGGVERGWQTILRSKSIYGPYEKKVVLEQGSTSINGPHQGAIVDTPEGKWWFYHFQHAGTIGRVVHLQPMYWHDEWPVIGVDIDRNGTGEPVYVWKKPISSTEVFYPQTDDNFDMPELGLQWQWNHNPADEAWSLSLKKGSLTLEALTSTTFRLARNTLTQKIMGYESEATVEVDISEMVDGQRCGLVCMGGENKMLGIRKINGALSLYFSDDAIEIAIASIKKKKIYLRVSIDIPDSKFIYSYSLDNKNYLKCGETFYMKFGYWKGARIGLYCYNIEKKSGLAIFDSFVYKHDGEKNN
ncbi:MAG: glycoside hydrolase 43 family protein [Tannerella sp.]|jgi:beta-xylosidase|nr:glycoside hydrolase 43 family protein [Tannerella sp.]